MNTRSVVIELILYLIILLHVLEFCIQVLRLSCNVLSQSKFIRF
jgi:hypothetical protein